MVVYFVDYIVVENFASNKNLDDSSNQDYKFMNMDYLLVKE